MAAGLLRSGHPGAPALVAALPKPAKGPALTAWEHLAERASGQDQAVPSGSEEAVAFACALAGLPPTIEERKALQTSLAKPYPFHDLDTPPFWDLWGRDAKALLGP